MHILLTGGTGLIGSALIAGACDQNASFTILSRRDHQSNAKVRYVKALEEIALDTRIDAVVNLAGESVAEGNWTTKRKDLLTASRIETTQVLINFLAMLEYTPPVLVSGSAVGWYGDQGGETVTEESNPHQEFTHELCRLWEESALAAERFGIRVCLLRTGLVLSSKGGFLKRMLLPFKLGFGGRLGSGKQFMPWVHIDDIVAMIYFLIHNKNSFGAFNGTAPVPVDNQAFTLALAKALKRPALLPLPARFLKIAFGEMSRLLLTGQKAIPEKFSKAGFEFRYSDINLALKSVI